MKLILKLFTASLLVSLSFPTFSGTITFADDTSYRDAKRKEIEKAEGRSAPKDAKFVEVPFNAFICPTKADASHIVDMMVASRGRYTTQYLDMYSRLVVGTSCLAYTYPNRVVGYVTGFEDYKNVHLFRITWKHSGYPFPNISTGWVIPQLDEGIKLI